MNQSPKILNIVIPEVIYSCNRGEAAIMYGLLQSLKRMGPAKVVLFSDRIAEDITAYADRGVQIVPFEENRFRDSRSYFIRRLSELYTFLQFVAAGSILRLGLRPYFTHLMSTTWLSLLESHVIVVGHDNLIVSKLNPRYLALMMFAKITRKAIVVPAASIGPLQNSIHAFLIKVFLAGVDLISIRDPESIQYLKDLGVSSIRLHLTADLAFLMKPATRARAMEILRNEHVPTEQPLLGIALGRMAAHAGETQSIEQDNVIDAVCSVAKAMKEQFGCYIVIITHSLGPEIEADDRVIAETLLREVGGPNCAVVIGEKYSAPELKAVIGELDLLIGSRTHSLIAAMGMSTPAIALTTRKRYKTVGIIGKMFGQSEYMYFTETTDFHSLIEMTRLAWNRRDAIQSQIDSKKDRIIDSARDFERLLNQLVVLKSCGRLLN